MGGALWYSVTHPDLIAGRDGAASLVVLAAVVTLITTGFMATAGRRMIRHGPVLAVLAGGAFLPILLTGAAFVLALGGHAGTDGGGILVGMALILSICAVPLTLTTSMLYVVYARTRRTD